VVVGVVVVLVGVVVVLVGVVVVFVGVVVPVLAGAVALCGVDVTVGVACLSGILGGFARPPRPGALLGGVAAPGSAPAPGVPAGGVEAGASAVRLRVARGWCELLPHAAYAAAAAPATSNATAAMTIPIVRRLCVAAARLPGTPLPH
jgi:hypothetical protein